MQILKATPLLFLTVLMTSAAVPPRRADELPSALRPVILLVHGRGSIARDSATFRRAALQSLRAGAYRATGDSLFNDGDVRLVWYADLMTARRSGSGSTLCARPADEGVSPSFLLRSLALVASDLLSAGASDSTDDDAHDIAGDLRFIGDPALQCDAEGRVDRAVDRARTEGRPVVVVAHSLGALVTWGYLQRRGTLDAHDPYEIQRLVTIGSPIGHAELRELLFSDTAAVALPRAVRSWVNAVNADDPFAVRLLPLDSAHERSAARRGVVDLMTGSGEESAHDLRSYLRDSTTAGAIVGAWCEAAEMRRQFAGCASVTSR